MNAVESLETRLARQEEKLISLHVTVNENHRLAETHRIQQDQDVKKILFILERWKTGLAGITAIGAGVIGLFEAAAHLYPFQK